MDRRQQLGQSLAEPPVAALGRLVEEPLQVTDVVPFWCQHLHLRDGGPREEPQLDRVGLRNDAHVMHDRVPQLPDDAERLVALPFGRRLLGEEEEVAALERGSQEAAEPVIISRRVNMIDAPERR